MIRAASHPPTPRRRPEHKAYKLRQQLVENPGSVDCPGFFFVAVKAFFLAHADFPGVCVVAATLLLYSHPGWAMDGTDDIVSD